MKFLRNVKEIMEASSIKQMLIYFNFKLLPSHTVHIGVLMPLNLDNSIVCSTALFKCLI
jgi:hypothetical protein